MRDEELAAAIREVQERVRTRVSQVSPSDLMPLVHARDAAEAKIAAIGTVNPRPPGFKNSIIQAFKRMIARALDWHIREQIEFNRTSMACVQASLEALTELNRGLSALAAHDHDVRSHWEAWRTGYEQRQSASEIQLLRSVSELQASFQHRVTLMEQNFRESIRQMHGEYNAEMDRRTVEIQKRMWDDIRASYDELIHRELRVLRQKQAAADYAPSVPATPVPERIPIDWIRFAEAFRGSRDEIREQQQHYVGKFAGAPGQILDLGCGRGEFLEAARDAGLAARGIDQNQECVGLCRSMGLDAECAELFTFLNALPDYSLGGAFCSQVVEHLPPADLPRLIQLLARKLRSGAMLVVESPNPQCLAIFAIDFYVDPTHTRPVPPQVLRFYLEEAGFTNVEAERLSPAVNRLPMLADLPPGFRETFFGGQDYTICGQKL